MVNYISTKKAQMWGLDLMIAIVIFLAGVIGFYLYSINYPSEAKENLDSLIYDGDFISENILSEGFPINWDSSSVLKIGILTNKKIDQDKLTNFYNLASSDYAKTRLLFSTKYDYYFLLSEPMLINSVAVEGIGYPNFDPLAPEILNLIKITRITIYNEKPIPAYIYVFERRQA